MLKDFLKTITKELSNLRYQLQQCALPEMNVTLNYILKIKIM